MSEKIKTFDELTISDDFLFCKVMEETDLLKKLLQKILTDIDFTDLNVIITQKTIREFYGSHGIRIDVYSETGNQMFAVEMQVRKYSDLPKRSRYYQSVMDLYDLKKNQSYRDLKDTYVIFICPFDMFGANMMVYTFRNLETKTGIELNDRTSKIFVNCTGNATEEYSGLKPFADYVMGKQVNDMYVEEIRKAEKSAKENPLNRREYMEVWEKLIFEREQGREEGREEGKQITLEYVIRLLMAKGSSFSEAVNFLNLTDEEIEKCRPLIQQAK